MCSRIGGEEFVILTIVTGRKDAEAKGARVRSAVAAYQFGDARTPIGQITTSIGIAMIPHSVPVPFDTIYDLADQALYAAKSAGRDRVMISELSATFAKRCPAEVKGDDNEASLFMVNEGRFETF